MRFRKGIAAAVAAATVASCMVISAPSAIAATTTTWPVPTAPMNNTVVENGQVKTVVTAAANGCYRSWPEILGLANPLCNPGAGAKVTDPQEALTAMTSDNDYGLYGSPASNSPDAYMWNYYYNFYAAANGLQKADPNVTAITCSATAAGFDTTTVAAYGGINAAFYHRPDIAFGIAGLRADGTSTYSDYVKKINSFTKEDAWYQEGDETYNPYLVQVNVFSGALADASKDKRDDRFAYDKFYHLDCLYSLAQAAQNVITDSKGTKTTRFGSDAFQYAREYEKYCRATQYAVLKAIDEGKTERKTVAYVGLVDSDTATAGGMVTDPQSTNYYDTYSGVYTWKTSAQRYMSGPNMLENCTNNIGEVNKLTIDSNGFYSLSAKDMMDCDAIILRTGNGMVDGDADADKIREILRSAGYTDESKYPELYYTYPKFPGNGGGNFAYCSFYGSIISFVYPEVINPSDMDAWYCETAYHVSSTYLDDAVNILFGSASLPTGYSVDLSKYSHDSFEEILDEGLQYYVDNKAAIDEAYPNIKASSYMESYLPSPSIANAEVKLAKTSCTYNGKAQKPTVKSVTLPNGTVLGSSDYTVSYSAGCKNAGTYTVTVTGTGSYSGEASADYTIKKAANSLKVTVGSKTIARGGKVSLSVKSAQGKVTYSVTGKGVSIKNGKVVVSKTATKGAHIITVKAAGNANYFAGTKKVTIKVK